MVVGNGDRPHAWTCASFALLELDLGPFCSFRCWLLCSQIKGSCAETYLTNKIGTFLFFNLNNSFLKILQLFSPLHRVLDC